MEGCKEVEIEKPFVRQIKIAFVGKDLNSLMLEPTWREVDNHLQCFESENCEGFIELSDNDETVTMIIFGQKSSYHIGIALSEDEFYYYLNGLDNTSKESVAIAGNYFKPHQVCSDYVTLCKIVRYFFETGSRLEEVQWESDLL